MFILNLFYFNFVLVFYFVCWNPKPIVFFFFFFVIQSNLISYTVLYSNCIFMSIAYFVTQSKSILNGVFNFLYEQNIFSLLLDNRIWCSFIIAFYEVFVFIIIIIALIITFYVCILKGFIKFNTSKWLFDSVNKTFIL